MTTFGELRFSGQKGQPGHCMVAQVWGPDGRSVAELEPTDDPAVATSYARLFALAPVILDLMGIAAAELMLMEELALNGCEPRGSECGELGRRLLNTVRKARGET